MRQELRRRGVNTDKIPLGDRPALEHLVFDNLVASDLGHRSNNNNLVDSNVPDFVILETRKPDQVEAKRRYFELLAEMTQLNTQQPPALTNAARNFRHCELFVHKIWRTWLTFSRVTMSMVLTASYAIWRRVASYWLE